MKRLLTAIIILVGILSSCFNEKTPLSETTAELKEEASSVVEPQQPQITEEELIELLEQVDAGNDITSRIEKIIGTKLSSSMFQKWFQDHSPNNGSYGSGGGMIPRYSNSKRGLLDTGYMPERIIFLYSKLEGSNYLLSDWLIVEKQWQYILVSELTIIDNMTNPMNLNQGERDEFQFGIVHFDLNEHIPVYERWFHPDEILKIDPDSGTLELIENVSPNQYVMIEGV